MIEAAVVICTMGACVASWCSTELTHTNRAVSAAASQHERAADPTDLRALLSPRSARFTAADGNDCVPPRHAGPLRELDPAARPRIGHARLSRRHIAPRREDRTLTLHAWFYEVNNGSVGTTFHPDPGAFLPR
ncbi:hypothetical protein AB0D14_43470 [Streptomyces sp. NPDC048484]|uniref:hypothetical protein n=1 Tax=Streptomyces sp. NPDC048484 TaxID=3155146 RepID=UPI0034282D03